MATHTEAIQKLYVAYFNRPADYEGLAFWEKVLTANNGDLGSAFDCFSAGRWDDAFEHLKALADAGNPDAARIALMLEAQGPRVFGKRFAIPPTQRERWGQGPNLSAGLGDGLERR